MATAKKTTTAAKGAAPAAKKSASATVAAPAKKAAAGSAALKPIKTAFNKSSLQAQDFVFAEVALVGQAALSDIGVDGMA